MGGTEKKQKPLQPAPTQASHLYLEGQAEQSLGSQEAGRPTGLILIKVKAYTSLCLRLSVVRSVQRKGLSEKLPEAALRAKFWVGAREDPRCSHPWLRSEHFPLGETPGRFPGRTRSQQTYTQSMGFWPRQQRTNESRPCAGSVQEREQVPNLGRGVRLSPMPPLTQALAEFTAPWGPLATLSFQAGWAQPFSLPGWTPVTSPWTPLYCVSTSAHLGLDLCHSG